MRFSSTLSLPSSLLLASIVWSRKIETHNNDIFVGAGFKLQPSQPEDSIRTISSTFTIPNVGGKTGTNGYLGVLIDAFNMAGRECGAIFCGIQLATDNQGGGHYQAGYFVPNHTYLIPFTHPGPLVSPGESYSFTIQQVSDTVVFSIGDSSGKQLQSFIHPASTIPFCGQNGFWGLFLSDSSSSIPDVGFLDTSSSALSHTTNFSPEDHADVYYIKGKADAFISEHNADTISIVTSLKV